MRVALLLGCVFLCVAAAAVRAAEIEETGGSGHHAYLVNFVAGEDVHAFAKAHKATRVEHVVGGQWLVEWDEHPGEEAHSQMRAASHSVRRLRELERTPRGVPMTAHPGTADPESDRMWHMNGKFLRDETPVHLAVPLDVRGAGITVGIVDDGTNFAHPDLIRSYARTNSRAVGRTGDSPLPHAGSTHGTATAGIVAAARDNGVCGSGIAPDAKYAAIRMLGTGAHEADEALALGHMCGRGDGDTSIYSNSWGPPDGTTRFEGVSPVVADMLEHCDSRGAIYVWAAGNGATKLDTCSADGFVQSPHTIAVGGATYAGTPAWYTEPCPAVFVAAPSSGAVAGITTTSTRNGMPSCRNDFGGTSAAAPAIAGVVALLLEANPHLRRRDVMHVLLQSAQTRMHHEWAHDEHFLTNAAYAFEKNGAGWYYSDVMGFGLPNATLAVQIAESWHPLPAGVSHVYSAPDLRAQKRSGGVCKHTEISFAVTADIAALEDVYLRTKISAGSGIKLIDYIYLESPAGTKSYFFRNNKKHETSLEWTFKSVQFWGESPVGTWKLALCNRAAYMATLRETSLILHGYNPSR